MRRLLTVLGLLALLLAPAAVLTSHAGAVEIFSNCGNGSVGGSPDVCGDVSAQQGNNGTNNPIVNIIKGAIDIISVVVGIGAVIGIVLSGVRLITASGDANAIASARTGLVYSLIGVLVAALAQAIVAFVLDKIT
ncbi:MAG TPA: hypothetical protein VK712_00685 [Verrucomicrobiae bacterium]|jgi:hypothetical protein|nr:hypothetical protein [Verrucomicrobiae bacterium]